MPLAQNSDTLKLLKKIKLVFLTPSSPTTSVGDRNRPTCSQYNFVYISSIILTLESAAPVSHTSSAAPSLHSLLEAVSATGLPDVR